MIPKEKAQELVNSFLYLQDDNFGIDYAKLCSINCVNEIIEESSNYLNTGKWMLPSDRQCQSYEDRVDFWNEVKIELEKL